MAPDYVDPINRPSGHQSRKQGKMDHSTGLIISDSPRPYKSI